MTFMSKKIWWHKNSYRGNDYKQKDRLPSVPAEVK